MNKKGLRFRVGSVGAVNLIKHILQFSVGVFVANMFSIEEKGLHFVFTSLAGGAAVLFSYGLVNSIVYHAKQNKLNFQGITLLLLFAQTLIILSWLALTFFWPGMIPDLIYGDPDAPYSLQGLFLLLVIFSLNSYLVITLCLAFSLLRLYAAFHLGSSFGLLVVLFLGANAFEFNIHDVLYTVVVFDGFFGLLALLALSRNVKFKSGPRITLGSVSDVVIYARDCYLGVSGNTILSHADSVVVSSMLDHVALGVYSIAKTFMRLLITIPQLLNGVLFGVYSELSDEGARALVSQVSRALIVVSALVGFGAYLYLDLVIELVYGTEFLSAYLPSLILICAGAVLTVTAAINPFFMARGVPIRASMIVLVSGSTGLVVSLLATSYYGVVGTAFAVLYSAIVTSILRYWFFKPVV